MRTIIAIGREFGSGGHEIAEKVAGRLGIPFYDKELLEIASKESSINEDLFREYDEKPASSLLYSLVMGAYPITDGGKIYPDIPLNHKVFLAQFEAIRNVVRKGPCVLLGRCADYVLKDNPNMISVFINSDVNKRIKRVGELYDIPVNKLPDFVKRTDKKRASYYNYYTDKKWGSTSNYDLCINSGRVGIDNAVDLIVSYAAMK